MVVFPKKEGQRPYPSARMGVQADWVRSLNFTKECLFATKGFQTIIAQTMVPVLTMPSTVNAAIEQAMQVFPAFLRIRFMVVSL